MLLTDLKTCRCHKIALSLLVDFKLLWHKILLSRTREKMLQYLNEVNLQISFVMECELRWSLVTTEQSSLIAAREVLSSCWLQTCKVLYVIYDALIKMQRVVKMLWRSFREFVWPAAMNFVKKKHVDLKLIRCFVPWMSTNGRQLISSDAIFLKLLMK